MRSSWREQARIGIAQSLDLCSALASSHDARIETSRTLSVVRITGKAFGWIGSTMAFGAVVRKP
jgi:hypothetical protein